MDPSRTTRSDRTRAAVSFVVNSLLTGGLVGLVVVGLNHSISSTDLVLWLTGSWVLRLLAAYFTARRTSSFRRYASAVWPLAAAELLAAFCLAVPIKIAVKWNWSECVAGAFLSAGFSLCLCGLWLAVERGRGAANKPGPLVSATLIAAGLAPGAFIILFAVGMSR